MRGTGGIFVITHSDLTFPSPSVTSYSGKEWNKGDLIVTLLQQGKFDEAKALIASGANVNVADPKNGWTPLMLAAGAGNCGFMKLLFDAGALPDIKSAGGWTALMFTSKENQIDAVRFLIEKGAKADRAASER